MDRVPIAEAAERLRVSRDTLERLIRAGRLKRYRRFGDRKTYVDLDEAKQVSTGGSSRRPFTGKLVVVGDQESGSIAAS